jgi:hypothetical protein
VIVTSCYLDELPRVEEIDPRAHIEVLVANSRLDQGRIRAAVDAVFAAHAALGAVFELRLDSWTSRPGGGWAWGVEPAGTAVEDVIARQRASFDMHTGRMFAVSMVPGAPERLVLTASQLCIDESSWQAVVEALMTEYNEGVLAPAS